MENSLLSASLLPPFSAIRPEHITSAISAIIDNNRKKVIELLNGCSDYNWENLVQPIEEMEDRLSRAWSPVGHMNSVVNSEELRTAYNECLPLLTEYGTELAQNSSLCNAYKQVAVSSGFNDLNPAQQKTIKNAIRDFKLAGVDLPEEKKARYKEISQKLSTLTTRFAENILDATNAWYLNLTNSEDLHGLPESALDMAADAANKRHLDGYVLSLQLPSYLAVMSYADSRELREKVYRAYVTRASELGENPKWDNTALIDEILALRHEQARLLGFKNYAERSLATKMAVSPHQVVEFLQDMGERSRPQAERDIQDVRHFARSMLGISELQSWDVAYVSEKMRAAYYELSQEQIKVYFPVDKVVNGLLNLVTELFGVTFSETKGVDTWHPDVRFFQVMDTGGAHIASFYFDLYARANKRGGAWMDVCRNRMKHADGLQRPVAYMTCNSAPPAGGKPALFTHDEVITLFHEFGHGLHHMLTEIDYPSVSGISGVEWDAVELPSQFMENWCWEKRALDMISAHYETGEPLPDSLFHKLIKSKNFQSALQILRQVEFSLFDLRLHAEYRPESGARIDQILQQVRNEVSVMQPPDFNRFQNSFSHIFAGGYAAGYYSYKWAEVLSADAFARFEEEGLFNPQVGKEFRDSILAMGGSRTALENFKAFRGREPKIDALLRHSGLSID